jgi:hypothetical protein
MAAERFAIGIRAALLRIVIDENRALSSHEAEDDRCEWGRP